MKNKLSTMVDRDSRVTDKSGNTGEFVKNGYNYEYRFNQYTIVDGEAIGKQTKEYVIREKPIVFCGFVAYLIERWHWEDNDYLFNEYYIEQRNKYIYLHENDDDKFLRDLEQEFCQLHEQKEMLLIQKSQVIYDFLDDKQTTLLNFRIAEYINFVRDKAQEYTINADTTTPKGLSFCKDDNTPEIAPEILTKLEKVKLITQNPIKWIGAKNLCAYLVDRYFFNSNPNDLWKIGEKIFGVSHLRQAKDNYMNSKLGKPKQHSIIDEILPSNN